MCMFASKVVGVSATKIFARMEGSRQFLAYEMNLSTHDDTAMVLPIPVASGISEGAVRFISLDGYPDFFRDLDRQFRSVLVMTLSGGMQTAPLHVHSVGAFEASFVPTRGDFDRLAPRFRLPERIWLSLPGYEDFGFVVFKLRAGIEVRVHPMAFSFPTRDRRRLFFPTVHVHDGTVHATAEFDHALYHQHRDACRLDESHIWLPSGGPAASFLQVERAGGLVRGDELCFVSLPPLMGVMANADTYVEV